LSVKTSVNEFVARPDKKEQGGTPFDIDAPPRFCLAHSWFSGSLKSTAAI